MAIIQISKIQQRSGNLVDLPQLDEAQFGFANDARRLFIGRGSPYDPENIEVLTSYSNISFSQIEGSDGANFNLSNATNGQTLTYVSSTNTWENWSGNASQLGNAKLQLGGVSNVSITGGATGYILETDGTGNLSWTSKGTLLTTIEALSNATPIIMTVANTTPYTNGLPVTISGANAANANTIVNGQTFYIKVAVDFPTSGNVELYITQDLAPGNGVVGTNLGSYTANSGVATALIGGSGVSNAGGSVNTIQFNNTGLLDGSANFTLTGGNLVTLNGNFVSGNVNGGNLVSANFLTGTLTTASQPNITLTGTLASLSVTGNSNVANINIAGNIIPTSNSAYDLGNSTNWFRDLYLSGTSIKLGTQTITSNASGVAASNAIFTGSVTASANVQAGNLVTTGAISATGNANVGNIGATAGLFTTVAGSLTTAGQPNITSTGTLVSLSVSGNANIGNIGTAGLITATGNVSAGNLISNGLLTAIGNITGANIITTGIVSATGNVTGGNIITSGSTSATGNGTFGNISTGGVLSVTGNANIGNIGTAGVVSATGNITGGNITSAGSVSTATLSASGNSNVGNLGVSGLITATGNITGGNLVTAGQVSAGGNVTVLAIKTDNYYYSNGSPLSFAGTYSNSNVASYLPTYTGNISAGNISATGNITGANLSASGNISAANFVGSGAGSPTIASSSTLSISATSGVSINNLTTISTGSNVTAGTITGNWALSSGSRLNATYADLAEYYEADFNYAPGTVLEFGGENEVTLASDATNKVAGVVTTNPAYVMNTQCRGLAVAIALQGRVPVKVRGKISKGDFMVSGGNGYARPSSSPTMGSVIGKALQNFDGIEGIIEIAVGRL